MDPSSAAGPIIFMSLWFSWSFAVTSLRGQRENYSAGRIGDADKQKRRPQGAPFLHLSKETD
jgi:hypothetical protein